MTPPPFRHWHCPHCTNRLGARRQPWCTGNTYDGDTYRCGCAPCPSDRIGRFHLCDYHEGYDDGIDFARRKGWDK